MLKNDLLIANFVSDRILLFREVPCSSRMTYVNRFPGKMSVRQKETKLSLTVRDIRSVQLLMLSNIPDSA